MTTPETCHYFKLYLSSKLQLENFYFWAEVEKYRAQIVYQSERIATNFVEEGAISQINIDATMRGEILAKMRKLEIDITFFRKAQAEVYKVLTQNNFVMFLRSDYCRDYLSKREGDKKVATGTTPANRRLVI